MNRIILIGNGFDLAHGLKTSYKHFINDYWTEFWFGMYREGCIFPHSTDFVDFKIKDTQGTVIDNPNFGGIPISHNPRKQYSYTDISQYSTSYNNLPIDGEKFHLSFKNEFFGRISERTGLENWLDIEQEYYDALKELLSEKDRQKRKESIKKLNEEFGAVKKLLEKYLTDIFDKQLSSIQPKEAIFEKLFLKTGIERRCVAVSKQTTFHDDILAQKQKLLTMVEKYRREEIEQSNHKMAQAFLTGRPYIKNRLLELSEEELDNEINESIERQGVDPDEILLLNFNYTSLFEKMYKELGDGDIINIHGELNNADNPIIFGYGDELDDDYKEMERTNDNDLLDNMKHVNYQNTNNYRRLLEFLQLGPYQIFVMGHSCGNSDRTLLNTIFEHPNCTSIMPFYYQWRNENTQEIKDNYTDVYKNISRNFNNKQKMRDVVVNKTYCQPLVPIVISKS
jgi:hypothetical protein